MRLLLCLALLAMPALGQGTDDAERDNLSFGEIQEMLDRFGDTTMRSIEDQLRTKLDEYEDALEKSRQEEAAQPQSTMTYRLTFTIAGASAPMSVLATPGEYSLNATQHEQQRVGDSGTSSDTSLFQCKGTVGPAALAGSAQVTFEGTSNLSRSESVDGGLNEKNAYITFSGSASIRMGVEQEIARNDDLMVMLKVDEIHDEPNVEQPIVR